MRKNQKSKINQKFPPSHLSALQCSDKGTALIGTGANGLGPALPEQTGHGGLVRQTERPPVLQHKHRTVNINSPIFSFQMSYFKAVFVSIM